MNPIFEAAREVEQVCRAAGFSFCFIGGLAVQRWGEPRMTADVDLTLITGFGGEGDDHEDRAPSSQPLIWGPSRHRLQNRLRNRRTSIHLG